MLPWIVFALVAVLLGGGIIGGIVLHEKRRTAALAQLAESLGLEFSTKGDSLLQDELKDLPLFTSGHGKKLTNLMQGESRDVTLAVFDYQYTTDSGEDSSTFRQTVACFRTLRMPLPPFSLRPEHFFHKLGQIFGYQDIDFPSHPKFSKRYLLRGQDEESVRRVFEEPVLDHFEQQTGVCLESDGSRLIYYRSSKRIKPLELRGFLEEAFAIYGLVQSRL